MRMAKQLTGIDQFVNLIREGYLFMLNRRKSLQTDVFETRFFGKKAICMGGKEAAELFYDSEKFKRYALRQTVCAKRCLVKKACRR